MNNNQQLSGIWPIRLVYYNPIIRPDSKGHLARLSKSFLQSNLNKYNNTSLKFKFSKYFIICVFNQSKEIIFLLTFIQY